jgi:hypothetical protein
MRKGLISLLKIVVVSSIPLAFLLVLYGTGHAGSNEWIGHITSGKPFRVVFDKTPSKFDDTYYTGNDSTDPMGPLKGGECYDITYRDGIFYCTGYNQATGKYGTWFHSNANPMNNHLSLWGRIYSFDGLGLIYDSRYGLVGHLVKQ